MSISYEFPMEGHRHYANIPYPRPALASVNRVAEGHGYGDRSLSRKEVNGLTPRRLARSVDALLAKLQQHSFLENGLLPFALLAIYCAVSLGYPGYGIA